MSSSAYATEEMLRILVPIAGLAAFSIITPMTGVILGGARRDHRLLPRRRRAPTPRPAAPTW